MKDWRILKETPYKPLLVHNHKNNQGQPIWEPAGCIHGTWMCMYCHKHAPKEIEDIALLARCERWENRMRYLYT